MAEERSHEVTQLLQRLQHGDAAAVDLLIPLVYAELHDLAANYLKSERPNHTLQPTALVHEAYLKLVGQREVQWQNRSHFLGIAAQAMRRILVDYARRHRAAKRGGGPLITLQEGMLVEEAATLDLIAVNDALARLAELDERQARIVELRFFGGLKVEEIADLMEISTVTVKREWRFARAWFRCQLGEGTGSNPEAVHS
jgi:RNA polymerase sigma factor (TIGR02999 family)